MAAFDFSFDEDFMKSLGSLAQVERYAPKMINESLPILEKKLKRTIEIYDHIDSGDLLKSISVRKAKKSKKGGFYGCVYPKGVDSKGMSNAEKLIWLEYGTKHSIAYGIVAASNHGCETALYEKMQEVFEREALRDL